ncbi:MAG: hypothetical protein NTV08_14450 [Verrucomicrobia bacterium]|jgi:hypothetical protein|nr:hypothetical protein [Verrucomicrobiota bacterium]
MKLIISGVPCSGKTYFGDWLRDVHGFAHANLESRNNPTLILPPKTTAELPDWLASLAANVVVTWGFPPNQDCIELIEKFQKVGFAAWWFAADHQVARNRYIERDGIEKTVKFFDPQIEQLSKASSILNALYENRTIETLVAIGYKPLAEIHQPIFNV